MPHSVRAGLVLLPLLVFLTPKRFDPSSHGFEADDDEEAEELSG